MLSYLLLPLSIGAFPHLFSHWLSAKNAAAFRSAIVLYPLCFAVVWFPSVALGAIGRIDFPPPLDGPILVKLILSNAGGLLAGCLGAGVFAARADGDEFERLMARLGFDETVPPHHDGPVEIDASHPYLRFDRSRCITCRRCLNICEAVPAVCHSCPV